VHSVTSQTVVDTFLQNGSDAAAGVKQQLEADQKRLAALVPPVLTRLLPGNFMVIQQAMGLPNNRGEAATQYLRAFVEEMKHTGFVAASLARHKIQGAAVAPLA
jgi:polar amino acid transport system substrate-binding protein